MFELAGALLLGLLSLLGIKYLLSRGVVLGSRRKNPERDAKRAPVHQRGARREHEAERRRQPEQEHPRQRERPAEQSEETVWWRALGVSPDASADEIRRSYLRKISESHPDRVAWLAPELLPEAERRSKTLNAAYAQATRARQGGGERGDRGPPPSGD